ncbi:hypothetical protein M8J77_015951 [Diaphorina citri]|nr:hypothetical protein M8J77_015951 [Diaphorina citri]
MPQKNVVSKCSESCSDDPVVFSPLNFKMAETQPSNSEHSVQHLSNGIPPHLSSVPICNECGIRFENFNSLYNHIEYYHKPKWNPHSIPHLSDPNSNFHNKPEINFTKSETIFVKSEPIDYHEPANNFHKSEQDDFIKSEQPDYTQSESNFIKTDNEFYKNSVKSEIHQGREDFSPRYDEPPVQSPRNNHRDFSNGFPNNGFRPKNGTEGPEAQILDLDSQRVHHYQPPVPQVPPPVHQNQEPVPFKHHQPSMEDAYDTVSTTTTSPPDSNGMSVIDQPYPKQKQTGATQKSGGSWKSNEARRPKTYLCSACNKWFTSSGHLKRHYNTTLHKNAVKHTGQPDPCTLPVSAHHHPYRDPKLVHQTSNGPPASKTNGRASSNSSTQQRPNGTPTPDPLSPDQEVSPQHTQPPHLPQHMMAPSMASSQPQTYRDPQFSPKMSVEPSYSSPSVPKDPPYVLNNNYSQDPPNLMAGPSETSEGLLPPPPPPTSYYQQLMPLPSFQPPPPTSMQAQNFLPLTTNYPNFQAPHVSSTQPGTNINLIGNHDVLGQHVDEKAFLPLLMQATRDANTFLQLQKQYVAMNIPEEYVGGLPSPREVDFSNETNPESLGISFNNDSTNVSSTSYVNYSFHSGHSSHSAPSPDSAFSPSCSFDNNNVDSAKNLEREFKPSPNFINQEVVFPESTTPDENSSNVITSTNGILSNDSLLSPNSFYEDDKVEDPLATILRCDDCDKVFNKSCYLKQHIGCFHSGDKPFKCPRCGKRFMEKLQFEKHLTKHGGEKPHKCDVCPKSFHHKTDLRRHSLSHNAEKPYMCPLCSKGFIRKDHMLKHTNIHKRKNSAHQMPMAMTVSPITS